MLAFVKLEITFSISVFIHYVCCLFSTLSCRVGTLQNRHFANFRYYYYYGCTAAGLAAIISQTSMTTATFLFSCKCQLLVRLVSVHESDQDEAAGERVGVVEWPAPAAASGAGGAAAAAGHDGALPQCHGQPHHPRTAAADHPHQVHLLSPNLCWPPLRHAQLLPLPAGEQLARVCLCVCMSAYVCVFMYVCVCVCVCPSVCMW